MCLSMQVDRPGCVLSEGTHAGHEFVTVHNSFGYRCGYVKVEAGHPWHSKGYDEVDADAHGGLTFAEPDKPCDKGGSDTGWWFGFDCAHAGDAPDPALPRSANFGPISGYEARGTVRTQEYVEGQCRGLAAQAAAAVLDGGKATIIEPFSWDEDDDPEPLSL